MVRYAVVRESSLDSFCEACEKFLNGGWTALGGVSIQSQLYVQSFTMTEPNPSKRKRH